MSFKNYITEIPNFPIDGVNFKDLSPLIGDSKMFREAVKTMGDLIIWEDTTIKSAFLRKGKKESF